MPTVKEHIKHLSRYNQEEHLALAVWSEDDVLGYAKDKNKRVTKEDAQKIIDEIDRRQDCSVGITWDTIDCYLDDYPTIGKCNYCGEVKESTKENIFEDEKEYICEECLEELGE